MMDGNASTESGSGIMAELSMCPYCYSPLSARLRALPLIDFLACGGVDGPNNLLRLQLGRKTFAERTFLWLKSWSTSEPRFLIVIYMPPVAIE